MAHYNSLQENKKSADRASHRAHKVRARYCANSEEREETSAAYIAQSAKRKAMFKAYHKSNCSARLKHFR